MMKLTEIYGRGLRKVLTAISLLCLLVSISTVTASAQETATITASSCTVERDTMASVTFNLKENPGIWGMKLKISYDHSALTLESVTNGSVFESGEFTMSEELDKDPYVIVATSSSLKNKTARGTIVSLNFTVNSDAEFKSYPVAVEISQAINVEGEEVSVSAGNGTVTVVDCTHADKEWSVMDAAQCEITGTENLTCKKCGTTFDTRVINATGHQHTEIRNATDATNTAEGYTGDTYCTDCGKLVSKGETIPKLADDTPVTKAPVTEPPVTEPPVTKAPVTETPTASTDSSNDNEPEMISGNDVIFNKDSSESLVFVSSADFSEFVRVEIDGTALDEKDYTVNSGSTIVTISADCLNRLDNGLHTVSIISVSGTATTQFTVRTETETFETEPSVSEVIEPSQGEIESPAAKSSAAPIIIAIIIIVLVIGGVGAFFLIKRRRV
ncbi:MAG: cohesin domain-containing protein [Lachnospiraceae bacterium]|nr:cohesin domain-containing protein [Lachnospiraceae bacterium]